MAKLILLTAEKQNWVPKQIVEYAKKAKLDTEIIDPMECYIHLSDENYISYKGTKFTGADIVIPRLSEDNLDYKVAIINHLEKMGIAVLNSGQSMRTASNKIETQILLNANEIKTPKTALFTSDEQLSYAVESIGGKYPVIVKTVFGTHGVGVIRADSEASLRSIVQQLLKTNVEFMLQEYIEHKESGRILLLNGEVLSSVMRTVPESDFRSNAHLGAELKAHKPSKEEIEVCKKSAELLGIKFAAVDYIVDGDNIIVFEVNGSPGYESMQKVVDIDITEKLIDFCKTLKPSEEEPKEEKDQEDFSALSIEEGPTEEEEEEEEKTVDIDREVAKETDKKETKKALQDDDKVDVEVKSHHNIIDPERWDHEEENIIGTITSVVIKHFNEESPIEARVDTGANTSSLGAEDIKIDGNIVKFTFNNTRYKFHLLRVAKIKQADSKKTTQRPVVRVDLTINGQQLKNIEININKRSDMKFPMLLGRQTLAQAGLLVNPAANNIDKVSAYLTSKEEE